MSKLRKKEEINGFQRSTFQRQLTKSLVHPISKDKSWEKRSDTPALLMALTTQTLTKHCKEL